MKKNIFLIGYALCFAFLGCANNPPKSTHVVRHAAENVALPTKPVLELPKTVQDDTSRYQIEYVTFGALEKSNPELFRKYSSECYRGLPYSRICIIKFWDKKTNTILKTFNVFDEDPYQNLNYKRLGRTMKGGFDYEIAEMKENDRQLLTMQKPNMYQDDETDQVAKSIEVCYSVYSENKTHAIVRYTIYTLNSGQNSESSGIVCQKEYFKIFNVKGEKIMDWANVELLVGTVNVTLDDKFLAADVRNDGHERGLGIFDIQRKERVLFKTFEDGVDNGAVMAYGNYISKRLNDNNNHITYLYFDISNNVLFSKEFDLSLYSQLLIANEEKITYVEVKTGRVVDYYIKKDFETSKIFEK